MIDPVQLLKDRKFAEAAEAAQDIITVHPSNAEAYNLLGVALANMSRPEEAILAIEQALELKSGDYGYARNLVNLLCRAERFDEANAVAEQFARTGHPSGSELINFAMGLSGRQEAQASEVFNEIYKSNAWGAGSGFGSVEAKTKPYRDFLQRFLRENAVQSVVDLGCGDWQIARHIDWTGIKYTGLDASSVAIERARSIAPGRTSFEVRDAINDELPPAELLIMKDVLQHWPIVSIQAFLPKLVSYRWALLTNSYSLSNRLNTDIRLGSFRPLDLASPPFDVEGACVFSFAADEEKRCFLWCRATDRIY